MNRIFKRKLVFCKSLFTVQFYPIYKRGKKNLKKKKKKKDVRRSLSWGPVLQVLVLQVQSSPV